MSSIVTPNNDQQLIMKEYADTVDKMIKIIFEYEQTVGLQQAMFRAYESVHWFHSAILNGAQKSAKEGELQLKSSIN